MSATTKRADSSSGGAKSDSDSAKLAPSFPFQPFKPQKTWFVVLVTAFAIWVGFLVGLYFLTVYPHRHPDNPAATLVTP